MLHAPSFERIVVTGGTGFIGRHLLEVLVAGGFCPVAIVRRIDKAGEQSTVLRERVRWIELDLLDHEAVSRVVEAERPTVLFHLAATRGAVAGNRATTEASCRALNVDATAHLLGAAEQVGVERIVLAGSAEEYGNQSGPFDESSSLEPVSVYGKTKAEATRLALAMYAEGKCPVAIARLFTVYGPNQPRGMFVSDAISAAISSEPFSMSEGMQERDLVYVEDVVRALIALGRTMGIDGRVFNLGSGNPMRLRDVAGLIWQISETDAPLLIGDRPRSADDMQVTWANISLARECFGWQPFISLEDGLRATIRWARDRASQSRSRLVVT